jgi:hypothetical protein
MRWLIAAGLLGVSACGLDGDGERERSAESSAGGARAENFAVADPSPEAQSCGGPGTAVGYCGYEPSVQLTVEEAVRVRRLLAAPRGVQQDAAPAGVGPGIAPAAGAFEPPAAGR